jgi:hypothetical protein
MSRFATAMAVVCYLIAMVNSGLVPVFLGGALAYALAGSAPWLLLGLAFTALIAATAFWLLGYQVGHPGVIKTYVSEWLRRFS